MKLERYWSEVNNKKKKCRKVWNEQIKSDGLDIIGWNCIEKYKIR